jgi:hypothetical protein
MITCHLLRRHIFTLLKIAFQLYSVFLWYALKIVLAEDLIHQPSYICPYPNWRDHSQEVLQQKFMCLFYVSVLHIL